MLEVEAGFDRTHLGHYERFLPSSRVTGDSTSPIEVENIQAAQWIQRFGASSTNFEKI